MLIQGSHAGGGSGGSVFVRTSSLKMTGQITCNGGSGAGNGGGGSGGSVNVFFNTGTYHSNLVTSKGMPSIYMKWSVFKGTYMCTCT